LPKASWQPEPLFDGVTEKTCSNVLKEDFVAESVMTAYQAQETPALKIQGRSFFKLSQSVSHPPVSFPSCFGKPYVNQENSRGKFLKTLVPATM